MRINFISSPSFKEAARSSLYVLHRILVSLVVSVLILFNVSRSGSEFFLFLSTAVGFLNLSLLGANSTVVPYIRRGISENSFLQFHHYITRILIPLNISVTVLVIVGLKYITGLSVESALLVFGFMLLKSMNIVSDLAYIGMREKVQIHIEAKRFIGMILICGMLLSIHDISEYIDIFALWLILIADTFFLAQFLLKMHGGEWGIEKYKKIKFTHWSFEIKNAISASTAFIIFGVLPIASLPVFGKEDYLTLLVYIYYNNFALMAFSALVNYKYIKIKKMLSDKINLKVVTLWVSVAMINLLGAYVIHFFPHFFGIDMRVDFQLIPFYALSLLSFQVVSVVALKQRLELKDKTYWAASVFILPLTGLLGGWVENANELVFWHAIIASCVFAPLVLFFNSRV